MSPLLRKTLIGVALGVVIYAWPYFLGALALSAGNYLLRFVKWELSLRWLGVRSNGSSQPPLPYARSLLIFLSGLSMSVTPGKLAATA